MNESRKLVDKDKLTDKRIRARLSQTGLAARTGLNQGYISQLEKGTRGGSPETLGRLADFFGCDITELMPDQVAA